jgi:hypothetical protein
MISNRMRPRVLGTVLLGVLPQWAEARQSQSTPAVTLGESVAGSATPAATPADHDKPELVEGRYQLPDDPAAIVIELRFGNPTLPPEYQYGYDVTVDASGHAVATISPVGSRASTPTADRSELTAELGEDGLQDMLAELDALGLFALPPEDPDRLLIGGEVDRIEVTLTDGQWRFNSWSLDRPNDLKRFAAAHEVILRGIGMDEPPGLGV